jgi:hypothetical protein
VETLKKPKQWILMQKRRSRKNLRLTLLLQLESYLTYNMRSIPERSKDSLKPQFLKRNIAISNIHLNFSFLKFPMKVISRAYKFTLKMKVRDLGFSLSKGLVPLTLL